LIPLITFQMLQTLWVMLLTAQQDVWDAINYLQNNSESKFLSITWEKISLALTTIPLVNLSKN
jgi:hypothetical protein